MSLQDLDFPELCSLLCLRIAQFKQFRDCVPQKNSQQFEEDLTSNDLLPGILKPSALRSLRGKKIAENLPCLHCGKGTR